MSKIKLNGSRFNIGQPNVLKGATIKGKYMLPIESAGCAKIKLGQYVSLLKSTNLMPQI